MQILGCLSIVGLIFSLTSPVNGVEFGIVYCYMCTECDTVEGATIIPCPGQVCVKIRTDFGSIHRSDRICHSICPSSVSSLVQSVHCCSTDLCNSSPKLGKNPSIVLSMVVCFVTLLAGFNMI